MRVHRLPWDAWRGVPLLFLVCAVVMARAQIETYSYDDTPVASMSSDHPDSKDASWMVTIEVTGLTRRIFDSVYATIVQPVASASASTLCSMDVTVSSRRARLVVVCPADPTVIDRIAHFFVQRYGEAAVKVVANTPVRNSGGRIVRQSATTQWESVPWALDRVDSRPKVYDNTYTYDNTCADVDVWTIDTGVYTSSVEFGGRATNEANYIGGPNSDCQGHGSFVGGLIAGATYGVCKAVRLRAVKALDCKGQGTVSSVMRSLDHVEEMRSLTRATVINLSLESDFDSLLNDRVNSLVTDAGIAVVVAAGNDGALASYYSPASAISALTVAATDMDDAMASFSNFGSYVDIAAPGVSLVSVGISGPWAIASGSGTSFSAPLVAGAVALRWALESDKRAAVRVMDSVVANATPDLVTRAHGSNPSLLFTRLVAPSPLSPPPPPLVPPTPSKPAPVRKPARPVVDTPASSGGYCVRIERAISVGLLALAFFVL